MRADQHRADDDSPIRLRFAPSPTGALHIGGARTALYNWLAARHDGRRAGAADRGHRPRALDRRRTSSRSSTRCAGSSSTGTRGRSRQADAAPSATRRRSRGCSSPAPPTATRRPPRTSRPGRPSTAPTAATAASPARTPGAAVRLRVPDEGETVVEDLIRGPVSFPNRSYDDFVIARGDGTVLYNFAVAVDDAEMGITDVVRGDDHLSNTPKQLLVLAALGARAAALRAPAAAARPRRQQALQAPRRRLGAGAARRRLPAGGGPQLPGAARLGRRRRRDPDPDRGAGRALPGRGRRQRRRRSSTRRSCAGSTAATCARCRSTSTRRRSPRHLGREAGRAPARRLRDRPGESPDAGRGLAADPLPLRAAGRRREGLAQGDEGRRAGGCWRRRARRWRAADGFDAGGGRGGAGAAAGAPRGQAGQASTSRSGSRSPAPRSRPGSSSRWPRSGARSRWRGSTPRRIACGQRTIDRAQPAGQRDESPHFWGGSG